MSADSFNRARRYTRSLLVEPLPTPRSTRLKEEAALARARYPAVLPFFSESVPLLTRN